MAQNYIITLINRAKLKFFAIDEYVKNAVGRHYNPLFNHSDTKSSLIFKNYRSLQTSTQSQALLYHRSGILHTSIFIRKHRKADDTTLPSIRIGIQHLKKRKHKKTEFARAKK